MVESISLFEEIMNVPYWKDTAIILFLNKTEVFNAKIMKSHLQDYFPAFTGLYALSMCPTDIAIVHNKRPSEKRTAYLARRTASVYNINHYSGPSEKRTAYLEGQLVKSEEAHTSYLDL